MDYAGVAMRGVEAAPFGGTPGYLPQLHPHALLIDAREAFPGASRADRNALLLKDLAVPAGEVLGVYTVPATQLLRVNFRSFGPFMAALGKLRRGVPWAAADGRLVFGWSTADSATRVRLTGVPEHLDHALLREHLSGFGQVLSVVRGLDEAFPKAYDGRVTATLLVKEGAVLPHFIQLLDRRGAPADLLFVHVDGAKRYCFRCGLAGHVGLHCKAAGRHPGAPASLWSTLVVSDGKPLPRPAFPAPAPAASAPAPSAPAPSAPAPSAPAPSAPAPSAPAPSAPAPSAPAPAPAPPAPAPSAPAPSAPAPSAPAPSAPAPSAPAPSAPAPTAPAVPPAAPAPGLSAPAPSGDELGVLSSSGGEEGGGEVPRPKKKRKKRPRGGKMNANDLISDFSVW